MCFTNSAGIKRTVRSIVWERLHPAAAHRRAEKVVLLAEELLGFLFSTYNGELLPAFDCLENHLPTLRIGWRRLVGPADALMDVSFEELIARTPNWRSILQPRTPGTSTTCSQRSTAVPDLGNRPAGESNRSTSTARNAPPASSDSSRPGKNICSCSGTSHASITSSAEPSRSTAARCRLHLCSTTTNPPENLSDGSGHYSTWPNAEPSAT